MIRPRYTLLVHPENLARVRALIAVRERPSTEVVASEFVPRRYKDTDEPVIYQIDNSFWTLDDSFWTQYSPCGPSYFPFLKDPS